MIPLEQKLLFVLVGAAGLVPLPCDARAWFVKPDGSGDAPTIQAAVDLSVSGDTIELDDGTFLGPGNRDVNAVDKALTFRSRTNTAEDCIIDCQGTAQENHRGFIIQGRCDFYGLTVRNAYTAGQGGAIFCYKGYGVGIYDCVFTNNRAISGGALWFEGVFLRGPTQIEVRNSTFRSNDAANSGAVYALFSFADFVECQFIGNTAATYGGGMSFDRVSAEFTKCLFVGNEADEGGALRCLEDARLTNCTFVGNRAHDVGGGAHISSIGGKTVAWFVNCILAFGAGGGAVSCEDDYNVVPMCCDIFGNEGGDWVECLRYHVGQHDNVSLDPLFCDMAGGDYSLSADSPCAAENNSCGLIGAFDVGCGPTASESKSWGRIKSLYR